MNLFVASVVVMLSVAAARETERQTQAAAPPSPPTVTDDWSRFRGPNGTGIAETTALPLEFGPEKNVLWKTAVPAGHSSPVLTSTRIFMTGADEKTSLCWGSIARPARSSGAGRCRGACRNGSKTSTDRRRHRR